MYSAEYVADLRDELKRAKQAAKTLREALVKAQWYPVHDDSEFGGELAYHACIGCSTPEGGNVSGGPLHEPDCWVMAALDV